MIWYIIFPLLIIIIALVNLFKGKDYRFTYTLPPLDTTRGKLSRLACGFAGILLGTASLLIFNSSRGHVPVGSKVISSMIFIFSIGLVIFIIRNRRNL